MIQSLTGLKFPLYHHTYCVTGDEPYLSDDTMGTWNGVNWSETAAGSKYCQGLECVNFNTKHLWQKYYFWN